MKKQIHLSECPSCKAQLQIRRLECGDCGLGLEGDFAQDPLFKLSAEDLHFVRLFLHCEGSIRDMEKALGISYPTVKARLASVNSRLNLTTETVLESASDSAQSTASKPAAPDSQGQGFAGKGILEKLEAGEVDFANALAAIKTLAAIKKEGK